MEIRIGNGLRIGEEGNYKLSAPLSGLEAASIRNGDGLYAGRDGGYVSTQLYGHRTLIINGFYIASSCAQLETIRRELFNKLRIRYFYPIFIEDFSGDFYFTEAYLTDVKSDIETPRSGTFQITFLCPDPLLYAGGDGLDPNSVWTEDSLSLGENTIINPGALPYGAVFTLVGDMTSVELNNTTTGKTFELDLSDYIEAGVDSTLVVDMKKRLAVLDGESVNASRTLSSSWWELGIGSNDLEIVASGASSVSIKYRTGVLGI